MITPPFRLFTYGGYTGILCLACNRLSWNVNDVQHHYCGHCHVFLDDLPEMLRCDNVQAGKASLSLLEAESERAGADRDEGAAP